MTDEKKIQLIQKILVEWNPLGDRASQYSDLDDYYAEACDILTELEMYPRRRPERIVQDLLNEAFLLDLETSECAEPAAKIVKCAKGG